MKITSRQLRQLIREELLREEENPGNAMSVSMQKGKTSAAVSELTKTSEWFTNVVFPSIEQNAWPIVADKNYVVAYGEAVFNKAFTGVDPAKESVFIKRGTEFPNISGKTILAFGSGQTDSRSVNLEQLYEMLESVVIRHKLSVPMESFPD